MASLVAKGIYTPRIWVEYLPQENAMTIKCTSPCTQEVLLIPFLNSLTSQGE